MATGSEAPIITAAGRLAFPAKGRRSFFHRLTQS